MAKRESQTAFKTQIDERLAKKVKLTINNTLPDTGAFAKLEGKNLKTGEPFTAYITELPCILGREHENQPNKGFVSLGKSKTTSRIHAILGFETKTNNYYIEPRGRNSITVRKVHHQSEVHDTAGQDSYSMDQQSKRVKINSKDPIRIGDIGFYFLKSVT